MSKSNYSENHESVNEEPTTKVFEAVVDVDHRAYCGPRAISILTGVSVSQIERMLRRKRRGYRDRRGRKIPIRGTHPWEVIKVLKHLDCKVERMPVIENTIGRFCEDTKHLDVPFLVEVTGHFLVVHRGTMSDKNPRPTRRVEQAWKVTAPAEPKLHKPPAPQPQKPKPDIKQVRHQRLLQRIKQWETKRKRAENALRKLKRQVKYYERAQA
jgi:hypothetical protein